MLQKNRNLTLHKF